MNTDLLAQFFEFSNDLLCLANTEGFFVKVNPAFIKTLGFSEEELLKRKFLDFIHEEDVELTLKEVEKLSQGATTIGFENRYQKKDGTFVWLQWNSTPDPASGLLFAIARDVTEQKKMFRLLEQTQNIANIGAWELDPKTGKTEWTEQIFKIYGIQPGQSTDVEIGINQYHAEDQSIIVKAVNDAIEKKESFDVKLRFLKSNGEEIWVRSKGDPVLAADGSVQVIRGIFQDIDAEERMRMALATEENILQNLIKHTPAAVAMLDLEMKYLAHSDRWLVDYDLGEAKILGKSHYEVFPDVLDRWKDDHQRVLAGEVLKKDRDHWIREDGTEVYIAWELRPWFDSHGKIAGLIMLTQVITQLIETELGLQKTVEDLQKSNLDLEQFAYVASHDLREPLRMIGNFSELLEMKHSGDLNDQGQDYLGRIIKSAERLQLLVDSLLEFSRVGRKESEVTAFQLPDLLGEIQEQLHLYLKENNAVIEIQSDVTTVKAVRGQLGMVIYNLLHNGIKFNESDTPTVQLKCQQDENFLYFQVKDNGIGVELGKEQKIFGAFQRLHKRNVYPGSGVGLALCKKIVERHAGTISCSPQKQGSIFEFRIKKDPTL